MNSPAGTAKLPIVLALGAVLAQICYPLTSGSTRDLVTTAVVLLGAAAALSDAAVQRGGRFAVSLLLLTAGIGLGAEIVGVATGVPFGCYDYASDRLGPAVAGVPLVVPLAWTAGIYPVWVVATVVARTVPAQTALTAIGAVGWDLYLDPQMVHDGQWQWCSTAPALPGVDGIPVTNYLGWFVVAAVMAGGIAAAARSARPPTSRAVPIALFLWTWLGSALAHAVFLGPELRWSALYGLIGMGVLGVPLLVRLRRRTG
ncbi:carotenoid biosynthesis protein [Aldersonia sp. NBC_00410]|uniref:carotenoid biosynthesis protein n=1 Tax=Aldersonia sp. NBC_00410 TaxID=2975954 RepID=UPI002254E068|nr:carotenoid biosynthesis protein [Aldersonia sp. NBC_00410]MCX5045971.1 carotenoid biosynthesis protein [Aldersonia sp. NBC_00410]